MEDAVFYLGEKKESVSAEGDTAEKKEYRIAYGGDMPAFLENPEYRPLTEAEVEKKRILMDKHERRSMIVRRILYLEKHRMEILGYMSMAHRGRKAEKRADTMGVLRSLFFVVLFFVFLYLMTTPRELLMIGLPVGAVFLIIAILRRKASREAQHWRQAEWEMQLNEMEAEHEELMKEKDQLTKEIKELENA